VKKAFELLLADPKVKSIFINIFGGASAVRGIRCIGVDGKIGIMRCDYIAEGVIKATEELGLKIPLVVRLKGTKEAEAKQCVVSQLFRAHVSLTSLC
jgi:succinyl-CoA synthetase beta subunit